MPQFVVVMEGTGIKVPSVPEPIVGFLTTRKVKAVDQDEAIKKARNVVLQDWTDGEYQASNIGALPDLQIDSVRRLGLIEGVFSRVPNSGYTFYRDG